MSGLYIENKNDFIEYCLRQLGKPVIRVDVSPDQIEDAYEESLSYYRVHHSAGTERAYMVYEITEEDESNATIRLPMNVSSVFDVQLANMNSLGTSGGQLFDVSHQLHSGNSLAFDTIFGRSGGKYGVGSGLLDYAIVMNYMDDLKYLMNPPKDYNFNTNSKKLNIFVKQNRLTAGTKVLIGVWKFIDPEEDIAVFHDSWFRRYTACLIKLRWGGNMQKFDGVALPGGVTLNGQIIYDQALTEKNQLEEEMTEKWQGAMPFYIG